MKACEEIQGYLLDRVLGEILPQSIEVELREHLSFCPRCRRRLKESEAAWRSLDILEEVRFPESISRVVIREASAKSRVIRFLGCPYPVWRISALAAAASLLLAIGIYLAFHGSLPVDQDGQPVVIHSASTFIPGSINRKRKNKRLLRTSHFSHFAPGLLNLRQQRLGINPGRETNLIFLVAAATLEHPLEGVM